MITLSHTFMAMVSLRDRRNVKVIPTVRVSPKVMEGCKF